MEMSPKDVIRQSLDMSSMIISMYIGDLDDADLLIRPVPGINHIAWQLGHLISSERRFMESIKPGASPPLPEGFEENHGREKSTLDDPSKYCSLAKYQELWNAQHAATLAILESIPEADLDKTDPDKFPEFAPTAGAVLNMCGSHALMHCGQFVAVRRLRGKPIVI
jgi:hypothetical protein